MPQTKRTRRKDARPGDIIDAAIQEFAQKGYSGTSIGSIATRAQIARSTVYLYFADKEALIQEAFRVRVGDVIAAAQPPAKMPNIPFTDMFEKMLVVIYERLVGQDTIVLLRILVAEGNQFPELTRFYHDTILVAAEDMMRKLMSHGIARGEVRADALDYDPKLVVAPVILAGIWRLTFEQVKPLDMPRFIKGHVAFLTDGLLVR